MKTTIATAFIAIVATFSTFGMAASEHDGHGAMGNMGNDMKMQSKAPADTQLVDGTVKKVDKAAGKVTLAHGPLTNLGMNMAMTMAFRVKDAMWLDQMKEGDKIRFVADNINGSITVVKFEPVK
jgi:Cu(I)/Ag(I) efflux system protein CusF